MALETFQGSITGRTTTGTQATTGLGFQPKAIIFWMTGQTADAWAANAKFSIGMVADGSEQHSRSIAIEDNVATANSDQGGDSFNRAIILMDFSQTIIFRAAISSYDADGFTLNYDTVDGTAYRIFYIAFGGAELEVDVDSFDSDAANSGNESITGVGFQPEFLLLVSGMGTTASAQANAGLTIGFASSSSTEECIAGGSVDTAIATDAARSYSNGVILTVMTVAKGVVGTDGQAVLLSFDSDGFTINWATNPASVIRRVSYLAMRGVQFKTGNETQKTSTGTKATTGVGFTPKALFLMSHNSTASGQSTHFRIAVGGSDGTNEASTWFGDTDAADPTSVDMAQSASKVLMLSDADAPSAATAEADVSSFDSDGFTLDWTTADATARVFAYAAFGDPAAPAEEASAALGSPTFFAAGGVGIV